MIDQHGDAVEKGGLDEAYVVTLKSVLWAVVRPAFLFPLFRRPPSFRVVR